MEFNDNIAHFTCACGEVFQVLNETGDDWIESESAALMYAHQPSCPLNQEKEEV